MSNVLVPFTPDNCDSPVALVSPNCEQLVLDVISKCWDKPSSGFGDHYTIDELTSIQEQELLDEYNDEYAQANAW